MTTKETVTVDLPDVTSDQIAAISEGIYKAALDYGYDDLTYKSGDYGFEAVMTRPLLPETAHATALQAIADEAWRASRVAIANEKLALGKIVSEATAPFDVAVPARIVEQATAQ